MVVRLAQRALIWLEETIVEVLMAALMFVIVAHVVNRATLQLPTGGAWEFGRFCMIIIVFIGLAIGARERGHIRINLLPAVVKNERALAGVNVFFDILLLGLTGSFWYWSLGYLRWAIADDVRSIDLMIPIAIVIFSMVLGGFLACIYFVANLVSDLRSFRRGEAVWPGQY
jgi:TRAP-type C4-dicarboxylate transport system permease small subunit